MVEVNTHRESQHTVEIRIPTYKRPALLRQALNSVVEQSYSDWVAIIFDDSPKQEGQAVAESFNDPRVIYQPNDQNLGGSANIDQAFYCGTYIEGSEYATILEDDNWWYPEFLQKNIEALRRHNLNLLLRNQEVWEHGEGGPPKPTGRTTRGTWISEEVLPPAKLHAYLFFFEGISNGGLFWKTDIQSDLQVGPNVNDPGVQEYCRTLQIRESLLNMSEPLAAWTKMQDKHITRYVSASRVWGRARQAVLKYLHSHYGESIIGKAKTIADRTGRYDLLDYAMADILNLGWKCRSFSWAGCLKVKLKSLLRYFLVADPLKTYIQKKRPLE